MYECYFNFSEPCCNEVTVSGSEKAGIYLFYAIYNGRAAYYSDEISHYLFFMESPDRWVIEQMLGERNGQEWIRHEGNSICPDSVGNNWSLNTGKKNFVKNETINVQCTNVTSPGTKKISLELIELVPS